MAFDLVAGLAGYGDGNAALDSDLAGISLDEDVGGLASMGQADLDALDRLALIYQPLFACHNARWIIPRQRDDVPALEPEDPLGQSIAGTLELAGDTFAQAVLELPCPQEPNVLSGLWLGRAGLRLLPATHPFDCLAERIPVIFDGKPVSE